MAALLRIVVDGGGEACDAVLIDDDALVRQVWKTAAKAHGKVLKDLVSPADFEKICANIGKATPIYVDARLGNGVQGAEFARELSSRGFRRIMLATGDPPEKFRDMPWLSAVVGKDAPWS